MASWIAGDGREMGIRLWDSLRSVCRIRRLARRALVRASGVGNGALVRMLGTGIGVGISAASVHQHLIYTKRLPPAAIRLSPLMTRGRACMLVSLRF